MSDIIRSFRFSNPTYKRGEKTMDNRDTPFRLPSYTREPASEIPKVIIEGVPPIGKPPEDFAKKYTVT